MVRLKAVLSTPLVAILFVAMPGLCVAAKLESITVMALSPGDERVTVMLSDGKMQVLKPGDTVPGTQAVVMQILQDKLVVEETIENAGSTPVSQKVWIYKPTNAGGKSRVYRLDQIGPAKGLIRRPVNGTIK